MKISYYFVFYLYFINSISAQDNLSLNEKIDNLLTHPFFESCNVAVEVFDLTSEKSLYKKNEKLFMHPASNLKLFTSAAGLYFLGEDYKFNTTVYYMGEVEDSVLLGDVYIIGGFDPEFTSKDLDSLVTQIKLYGIKKINGNLYADISMMDSLYWGMGWMWDDDPNIYSPYLSPLCINKNGIILYYEPAEIGSLIKVEISPESNFYKLHNSSITAETDSSNIKITRDWLNRTNDIYVTGILSSYAKRDTAEINIYNPVKFFLSLMKDNFIKRGISLTGIIDTASLPEQADHIITFERPFIDILKNLNKESDNLNAESVLRALAIEFYGKPASSEKGVKLIDSLITLTGLDYKNYRIVDGSGLSFYNLISAESIIELLKFLYYEEKNIFQLVYDSLPIGGVDGTLENRMQNAPLFNNIHAKTGTLSGVSNLSGYLTTKTDHLIAFTVLVQNFAGNNKIPRYFQDELCSILCDIDEESE